MSMSNDLKTLKDMGDYCCGGNYCYAYEWKKDLRAEAIKWVKHFHNKKQYVFSQPFIAFFNITEEDLLK